MDVICPTFHASMSSLNSYPHGMYRRSSLMSVTVLTSHVAMGPCAAAALTGSMHHSMRASCRLPLFSCVPGGDGGGDGDLTVSCSPRSQLIDRVYAPKWPELSPSTAST